MVQNHIGQTNNPRHWQVIVLVLFIVNIIFIVASSTMVLISHRFQSKIKDEEMMTPLSSSNNTQVSSTYSENRGKQDLVSKKISEKTLINQDIDDEQTIQDILETAENEKESQPNYSSFTNSNWMDSAAELNAIIRPDLELTRNSSESKRSRRNTFKIFTSNRPNVPRLVDLRTSKSVPSLFKSHSPKNLEFTDKFMELQSSFVLKSMSTTKLPENTSKVSLSTIMTESSSTNMKNSSSGLQLHRTISLLNSNCSETNLQMDHITEVDDMVLSEKVKRSKSTSCIGPSKKLKRNQMWNSINGERMFLAQVNESILPPVLKSGESRIMEVKRRQESYMSETLSLTEIENMVVEQYNEVDNTFPASTTLPTSTIVPASNIDEEAPNLPTTLSPVGESEIETPNIEGIDDLDSANLPYVEEFAEPIDQSYFHGFDVNEITIDEVPIKNSSRKIGIYEFENKPYLLHHEEQNHREDYRTALNGLEKIPRQDDGENSIWKAENSPSSNHINNISLEEWNQKAEAYEQRRTRSGANFTGVVKLVSSNNLKTLNDFEETSQSQTLHKEFILPPVEARLDNIDNISDFNSTTGSARRPSYNLLSRSLSAPSLHTYRNISLSSNGCSVKTPSDYQTIPIQTKIVLPMAESVNEFNSVSSSPIKKILESPRRISNAFKKRARLSIGNSDIERSRYHKHTSSSISNAMSVGSAVSSRSGSPRKSLKSILTTRSHHRHSSSVPSFPLPQTKLHYHSMVPPSSNLFSAYGQPNISHVGEEPIDFWELESGPSSDRSRVSSVPSAVIGEYDREKWRTLKALQNNDQFEFDVSI